MKVAAQLLLIAASVGGLLATMAGVHWLARRHAWPAELQRKCVHVATGLYALTLPLTFSETWPVLLLCALAVVVMGVMRLPALAGSGIGSTIHGVERKSYGEILLAVAVGFTFFRSVGQPVLFVLPILVLTFSDAAAALTGVNYGRRLFAVEDGAKSVEGVVMFFLVTFILAMVTLLLMTDIARANVIVLSLVVAAFGALLEADSWRGLDNLFVPVGLHLFLQNNLETSPAGLVAGAFGFVALIAGLLTAAGRLGMTRHAARGYGVLAFLILSVTALHNALLPLCAFAAFLMLRRRQPCRSSYPDLDFLAAAAGTAVLWLFLGEWSGHNAINLYNLSFAGVATALAALLLHDRPAAAAALTAGLGALTWALQFLNDPQSRWIAGFAMLIVASLALCCAVALLAPRLFDRYRSLRAFALAMTLPLFLFIARGLTA